MMILDKQLANNNISNAYIIEGEDEDFTKEYAIEFANKIFNSYSINLVNNQNPDLNIIDKGGDIIDINTIRSLLKSIYLRPLNGKIKIYIIANAQNLRIEASNAMLKSLEELKSYIKILFTTTNSDLLLPTIRSRCQIISLNVEKKLNFDNYDLLQQILTDVYIGNIETYYQNKNFFTKTKEEKEDLLKACLDFFDNVIKFKYSTDSNIDKALAYNLKKISEISFDDIEDIIFLINEIKNGFTRNINYDLAIDKLIFTIYRKGNVWLKLAGIRFKNAGKIYYFRNGDYDLNFGDKVIVETTNGIEIAEVAIANLEIDESKYKNKLSEIIRKASLEDIYQSNENDKLALKAIEICKEKVKDHKLDMKIIDAKYTFDKSKLTFYFKSEKRVDFRSLVKDLAQVFKNRIELRQVGVRDHAKMIDHYGSCGQKCCCSRFLTNFKPLSIKMAKDQEITLDPTKISGVCGRLMCCLSYEDETYKQIKKQMPNKGQKVCTCDGDGFVLSNDYVREKCIVKVREEESDSEVINSYKASELDY